MAERGVRANRVRRDSWLGIGAVAVLVIALLGVFRYESSASAGSGFGVTFPLSTTAGPSAAGQTTEGAATRVPFHLGASNLTRVAITLTWVDDVGDPDTFHLRVTSPEGVTREGEASDGRVTLGFESLAPVPGDTHVLAASRGDAEARVAQSASSSAGAGAWSVTVTLVRAPGLMAPAGGVELQKDGANAWALVSTATSYRALVVPP